MKITVLVPTLFEGSGYPLEIVATICPVPSRLPSWLVCFLHSMFQKYRQDTKTYDWTSCFQATSKWTECPILVTASQPTSLCDITFCGTPLAISTYTPNLPWCNTSQAQYTAETRIRCQHANKHRCIPTTVLRTGLSDSAQPRRIFKSFSSELVCFGSFGQMTLQLSSRFTIGEQPRIFFSGCCQKKHTTKLPVRVNAFQESICPSVSKNT